MAELMLVAICFVALLSSPIIGAWIASRGD